MKSKTLAAWLIVVLVVTTSPLNKAWAIELSTDDLVSYWSFNEGEGTTAADSVGDNDAALPNGSMWTNGIAGGAIVASYSSSYASASGSFPTADAPRSLNLWFKHDTGILNGGGHGEHIVNYGNATTNEAFGVMMFTGGTWWFYGHGGAVDINTGITADDQWHMHTLVYDGTTVTYYLDGEEVASSTRTLNTGGGGMYFGNRMDPNDFNVAHGTIDEVSIWDVALNSEELSAMYNEGEALVYPLDGAIIIDTCEELQSIGNDEAYPLDGDYRLGSDIDCSLTNPDDGEFDSEGTWGDEEGFLPIGSSIDPFTGSFTGGGYAISNLFIDRSSTNNVGLFGYASTTISDLEIENFTITAGNAVGGLVGRLTAGSIETVTVVDSEVSGDTWVGGLVGRLGDALIDDSRVEVTVEGRDDVGGLVGLQEGGVIDFSSAFSIINATAGANSVGGFVGQLANGTISDSYASTSVNGTADATEVGGFVGEAYSTIERSYSVGTVSGGGNVGGFAGKNVGTITDSHARGILEGTEGNLGGFAGVNSGTITDSFAVVEVRGLGEEGELWNVGGFVGDNFSGQGEIIEVFSAGTVEVTDNYGQAGTFIGYNGHTVTDSYYWEAPDVGQGFVPGLSPEIHRGDFKDLEYELFSEWDFEETWSMDVSEGDRLNAGYPYLYTLVNSYQSETEEEEEREIITVTTCEELQSIEDDLLGDYVLGNDIDCSMTNPTDDDYDDEGPWSELGFRPLGYDDPFRGTFDGDGHVISNLYVYSEENAGLFGTVVGGEIRDVGLVAPKVVGEGMVGALVGYLESGSEVMGAYTIGGRVRASDVCAGGLIGISYGAVSDSYARTKVSGPYIAGGLVGCNAGVVIDSYSTGRVSSMEMAGGLVGDACCDAMVVNSFWDEESSIQEESMGGAGMTSAEMKDIDTYTTDLGVEAWSFGEDGVWVMAEDKNNGYPYLAWQTSWAEVIDEDDVIAITGEAADITSNSAVVHGTFAFPGLSFEDIMSSYAMAGMLYATSSAADLEIPEVYDIEFFAGLQSFYPGFAILEGGSGEFEDLFEGIEGYSSLAELACGTTYFYRAIAMVSLGDLGDPSGVMFALGDEESFSTVACEGEEPEEDSDDEAPRRSSRTSGSLSLTSNAFRQMQSLVEAGDYGAVARMLTDWSARVHQQNDTILSPSAVRDLELGMTGSDVRSLQLLLIGLGHSIPAGPTEYFGSQTRAALSGYQSANGIVPAAGYFGPITRAFMKAAGLTGLWW